MADAQIMRKINENNNRRYKQYKVCIVAKNT